MVKETLEAAESWPADGIAPRSSTSPRSSPMTRDLSLRSHKTGRCVIVHEAARTGGFGAEIAALIAERGLTFAACSRHPRHRIRHDHTPAPARTALHAFGGRILAAARKICEFGWHFAEAPCASSCCRISAKASKRPNRGLVRQRGDHVVPISRWCRWRPTRPWWRCRHRGAARSRGCSAQKATSIKVGAPLVEFARGGEDTGTVVGETRAHANRHRSRSTGRAHRRAASAACDTGARAQARCRSQPRPGSGSGGTITRADVERAARSLADAGPAEPLEGMRRAMAQRMAVAHASVPTRSPTRPTSTDGHQGTT